MSVFEHIYSNFHQFITSVWLVHCCPLLVQCQYIAWKLLVHCWYIAGILLVHCCHIAVTLLVHCCYIALDAIRTLCLCSFNVFGGHINCVNHECISLLRLYATHLYLLVPHILCGHHFLVWSKMWDKMWFCI